MKDLIDFLVRIYELSPVPLRMAYAMWIAFISLYIYSYWYDKFNSPPKPRTQKRQNYSNAFILLGLVTAVLYFFAKWRGWPIDQPIFDDEALPFTGIVVMLIGLVLIAAARVALNGYWGPHIYEYTNPNHNILISHGIYSSLRHPIYLGQVLMAAGTLLLSNSSVFLIFTLPLVLINIARSKREDDHLLEVFEENFIKYKDNTYVLVPGVY